MILPLLALLALPRDAGNVSGSVRVVDCVAGAGVVVVVVVVVGGGVVVMVVVVVPPPPPPPPPPEPERG
jgi:hypothetical protein